MNASASRSRAEVFLFERTGCVDSSEVVVGELLGWVESEACDAGSLGGVGESIQAEPGGTSGRGIFASANRRRGKVTGKRLGEIAEAMFLAKVAGLGFGVTKPWGDSEPYDFIVDAHGGHAGLWRVQVKSAHREGKQRGYSFHAHGHALRAYRERDVDALVALVVPENAWYVFPMRVFRGKRSVRLYPGSRRKRSRYEKFREAWGWWRSSASAGRRKGVKRQGAPTPVRS